MKQAEVVRKARGAIRQCLEDVVPLANINIKPQDKNKAGADYIVDLSYQGGKEQLIIEAKTSGEPRFARATVNQLLRCRLQSYPVFVAPYISPRSAEICRAENIGYLDLVGNCYLSFGNIRISQKGIPNPYVSPKKLRMIYAPKASRILRVLLANTIRPWKLQELAKEAEVSLGQVSKVKNSLLDREWIETVSEGIRLSNPRAMLAGWAENYTIEKNERFEFYSVKEIPDIEYDLASVCRNANVQYGLTGFSGAARWASVVRYKRIDGYVGSNMESIAEKAELKPVDSGGNVRLFLPYDEGIFYGSTEIEGTRVVSPVQAYLDLKSMGGRAEEAAQALLTQKVLASPEKDASSSETKRGE